MGSDSTLDDLKVESGIPCTGGDEWGGLRHTWLERRLLYELKMDRGIWSDARPEDPLPEVLLGIPLQVARLENMLERMAQVFSPSQLVDYGPLSQLDRTTKELLRSALHEAYVKSGVIVPYRERLRSAVAEFSRVAFEVEAVWRQGDRATKAMLWSELEAKAMFLKEALALPQGVILP